MWLDNRWTNVKIERYAARTARHSIGTNNEDAEGIGGGYRGPGVKIDTSAKYDGPGGGGKTIFYWDDSFAFDFDKPGWSKLPRRFLPADYKVNFYVRFLDRHADNALIAEIWFDVVIEIDKNGRVTTNELTIVDRRTAGAYR